MIMATHGWATKTTLSELNFFWQMKKTLGKSLSSLLNKNEYKTFFSEVNAIEKGDEEISS